MNRWLIEQILPQDTRQKALLYLPFNEPEACVKIVEEFGDAPGVVGFMVTSSRPAGPSQQLYEAICNDRGP